MLQCFDIEFLILGDLDCFKDEVPKLVKHLNLEAIKADVGNVKAAISALPISHEAIEERVKGVDKNHDAQALQSLFEKFASGEIERDDEELTAVIQFMQMRYTKGNKEQAIIEAIGQEKFDAILATLRQNNVFIWSKGDLETYYSDRAKELTAGKSKDIKALELSYLVQVETQSIDELFLNMDEVSVLVDMILPKP